MNPKKVKPEGTLNENDINTSIDNQTIENLEVLPCNEYRPFRGDPAAIKSLHIAHGDLGSTRKSNRMITKY